MTKQCFIDENFIYMFYCPYFGHLNVFMKLIRLSVTPPPFTSILVRSPQVAPSSFSCHPLCSGSQASIFISLSSKFLSVKIKKWQCDHRFMYTFFFLFLNNFSLYYQLHPKRRIIELDRMSNLLFLKFLTNKIHNSTNVSVNWLKGSNEGRDLRLNMSFKGINSSKIHFNAKLQVNCKFH